MNNICLIPYPQKVEFSGKELLLDAPIYIIHDKTLCSQAELLKDKFAFCEIKADVADNKPADAKGTVINLSLDGSLSGLGQEGYRVNVSEDGIIITAPQQAGVFYGIQTFSQLLPLDKSAVPVLPCLDIEDTPDFQWRGTLLDVSRHFMPVEFIKKWLDWMAAHKMNVFHWHLNDDQGWRLEIKKYPELTRSSAWRDRTLITNIKAETKEYDEQKYGGFYTQSEVKEIIDYARRRSINVLPEIEMPGHASAALAAYPQLACPGFEPTMKCGWGIFEDVYCAGKEEVFGFLEDIISEAVELFPFEFIHIGGDEVRKENWKKCNLCQKRMKENKLKNEDELQSYFIQRAQKIVAKFGRKLIGWDEILEGGVAEKASVMSWRGYEGGLAAARQQHYVVMTPINQCYLNLPQTDNPEEKRRYENKVKMEESYKFDPVPDELEKEYHKYILGGQASIWTEYIRTPEEVEYMANPRFLAIAERLWNSENKNYDNFTKRLSLYFQRMKSMDMGYCDMASN